MESDTAARVTALAARIAASWGQDFHHTPLAAVISDLYLDLIAFPPAWPEHRCAAFATDAADTTAMELTTLLDDHLDTYTQAGHGAPFHPVTDHNDLTTGLRLLAEDHLSWQLTDQLPALIVEHAADDPGRGEDKHDRLWHPPTTTHHRGSVRHAPRPPTSLMS